VGGTAVLHCRNGCWRNDQCRPTPRGHGVIRGSAIWKWATSGTCLMISCTCLVPHDRRPCLGRDPPPGHASVDNASGRCRQCSVGGERRVPAELSISWGTTLEWMGSCSALAHAWTLRQTVIHCAHGVAEDAHADIPVLLRKNSTTCSPGKDP